LEVEMGYFMDAGGAMQFPPSRAGQMLKKVHQMMQKLRGGPRPASATDVATCLHCGSPLLWSEDRGVHCDGCDEFDAGADLRSVPPSRAAQTN
jgi:hypothetical protein